MNMLVVYGNETNCHTYDYARVWHRTFFSSSIAEQVRTSGQTPGYCKLILLFFFVEQFPVTRRIFAFTLAASTDIVHWTWENVLFDVPIHFFVSPILLECKFGCICISMGTLTLLCHEQFCFRQYICPNQIASLIIVLVNTWAINMVCCIARTSSKALTKISHFPTWISNWESTVGRSCCDFPVKPNFCSTNVLEHARMGSSWCDVPLFYLAWFIPVCYFDQCDILWGLLHMLVGCPKVARWRSSDYRKHPKTSKCRGHLQASLWHSTTIHPQALLAVGVYWIHAGTPDNTRVHCCQWVSWTPCKCMLHCSWGGLGSTFHLHLTWKQLPSRGLSTEWPLVWEETDSA